MVAKTKKQNHPKRAVLALSGGMDSSSLLIHLLAQGYAVKAISFDYGQKHRYELQQAQKLIQYLNASEKQKNFHLSHHIIKLEGLSKLLHSALIEEGSSIPHGHYEDTTMKDTFVPNRNKIFSSIIQAAALSWSNQTQSSIAISLGIHAGDHTIYPDTTLAFREKDYAAFLEGNWDAENISFYTPFIHIMKADILKDLLKTCKTLSLSFDEILSRTFTAYQTLEYDGKIYSDYRVSSSIERIEAFMLIHHQDPLLYADDIGPVTWETACQYTKETLANATPRDH